MKLVFALAWRNLWRNSQRTLLTSGGIAFGVFLLQITLSLKYGQYDVMIDSATRMDVGHLQVQDKRYLNDPRLRFVVGDVARLQARIARQPGVRAVFPQAQTFALVSVGEHSFGARITGVDPDAERRWSTLPGFVHEGRYLLGASAHEAVLGSALARNLHIKVGAEIVVLGSGRNEGIAAEVFNVVGLVDSGIAALDRSIVQIPLAAFRDTFELGDEANMLVVFTDRVATAGPVARALAAELPHVAVRPWQELLPAMNQTIAFGKAAQLAFLGLLVFMVTFSILNTFVMTVFERTREFGMLIAIGMRPGQLQRMLQLESLMLCLLGLAIGSALGVTLTAVLAHTGIPMPIDANEALKRFNLPRQIYPRLETRDMLVPVLAMLAATQVAAFAPGLRLRRLQPVQALRAV